MFSLFSSNLIKTSTYFVRLTPQKKDMQSTNDLLSSSAWDAFKVMSTQCVSWVCDNKERVANQLEDSAAVMALQGQIYGLIYNELGIYLHIILSLNFYPIDRIFEQYFQEIESL